MDEGPVTAYVLYFVDGCGLPFGDALATVPKRTGVPDYCCLENAYTAEVRSHVPAGSNGIVIVPLTSAGPLTVGEITDFSDYFMNETTSAKPRATAGAVTSSLPSWSLLASVTFVAAASLLTSREQQH